MAWIYKVKIILRDDEDILSLGITKKVLIPLLDGSSREVVEGHGWSEFAILMLIYRGFNPSIEIYLPYPIESIPFDCGKEFVGREGEIVLVASVAECTRITISEMCSSKNIEFESFPDEFS